VSGRARDVEVVVKLGGGMLRHPESLAPALAAVGEAARRRRTVVVPGGGPFADAVRDADGRFGLSDDAAHWMAVLAMDQYAHLLAERLARGRVVDRRRAVGAALAASAVPVLAPSRWLRAADPLPHAWAVTSDSIAAWAAGALGARRLVLVKPPGAAAGAADAVDAYFARALPRGVAFALVAADDPAALRSALDGRDHRR
jgi:aspartokinase-like uncharacterized kinase